MKWQSDILLAKQIQGVIQITSEGLIVTADNISSQLTGCDFKSLLGSSFSNLLDKESSIRFNKARQTISTKQASTHIFITIRQHHHTRTTKSLCCTILPLCGTPPHTGGWLLLISDILRNNGIHSPWLTSIIELSNDAIVTLSKDATILSCSPSINGLLGYSDSDICGNNIEILFSESSKKPIASLVESSKRGVTVPRCNVIAVSKTGELLDLVVGGSPVCDINRNPIGSVLLLSKREQNTFEHKASEQYKAIVESSDDAIISKDINSTVVSWNAAAEKIFGYTSAEMVGKSILQLFPKDRVDEEKAIIKSLLKGERIDHFKTQRLHKSGQLIDVSVSVSPIHDQEGNIVGASKIARDITQQSTYEREVTRYKSLVDSSEDAIISMNLNGTIKSWNKAAERMFGYSEAEMLNQSVNVVIPENKINEEQRLILTVLEGRSIRHFRTIRTCKNGESLYVSVSISPVYGADGEIDGFAKIVRDISKDIEREESIKHQANHDFLTGLLNRVGFITYAEELLTLAKIKNRSMALFYADLDNFKLYNDTYGHEFGDKVLISVANALRIALPTEHFMSRFGGDEFVMSFSGFTNESEITELARKVSEAFGTIAEIDDKKLNLTGSLGIAVYPRDASDLSELLRKADHAMYGAKSKGKNQYCLFSHILESQLPDNYQLIEDLGLAIAKNELELYFQPIVDVASGKICKAEALVRWNHPSLGYISPTKFIPLAEKYGLIKMLGDWVMDTALHHTKIWLELTNDNFQISINKSAFEFYDPEKCIRDITEVMLKHSVSGRHIVLEITEHSLIEHTKISESILKSYDELGINIAIDDFGTGYSSFVYIKRYPVNFIKIDRSFVMKLKPDTVDYHLCDGIIKISQNLGIGVIAEGIETEEEAQMLKALGCNYWQGYAFGYPLPAEEFEELLVRQVNSQT